MMHSISLDYPRDPEPEGLLLVGSADPYLQASDTRPRRPEDDDFSEAESDEEYTAHLRGEIVPGKKKGGYDSRIEQILYENPQLPILITDAGKSSESGGKYIVYTIRTGACHVFSVPYKIFADRTSGSRGSAEVF